MQRVLESDTPYFVKGIQRPVSTLSDRDRALLNRRGNAYLNEGKLQEAARVFITTGYHDGLTRIGDVYMRKADVLTALRFYYFARNEQKMRPIVSALSVLIRCLI
ncbi:hypothetical protein [Treponema pallidum]|uniref:Uncharacterized protein TP_0066 n=3 Tax=Treponema pallidum TaxID=160 RepID=Y066_TREPA|nr:hypothetical protein [Treponema pallidum]O83105.1 RecName: Full=Uncharacterized protein TP_0066 [Treponema pallidum subsp. pallidum str. Nichols]AAC65065.1 predicted coding region TP0066 [Treponema pallidum subsp. pallidum str. Nichols]ACD70493.1 hypothetical protein TPASS_0066 [Treponema pallidum subsp. pallidum SS14]AFU66098.1 hypothetical protein TPAMA_0066 [Treponema pallidum subsp. pallidum str. Mexico A]AGN75286.1 hypothetical protein TPANIC_0066 [Treponema pallidum subsp. pallidum st